MSVLRKYLAFTNGTVGATASKVQRSRQSLDLSIHANLGRLFGKLDAKKKFMKK